jgi:transcription-repair coupling factor (superfamily II helicase)
VRESQQLRLSRLYPRTIVKGQIKTILVPRPATAPIGGQPLRDVELLHWARDLIDAVLVEAPAVAAG